MDTQETKEAGFTPMQSMQVKIDKLESGQDWLKYVQRLITGVVLSVLGIGFVVIFFMLRETRQDIQRLESNTRQDIQRLESKLDLLIQNQAIQQDISKTRPAKRQAKR